MVGDISAATRTEVLGSIRNRYAEASKRDRSRMLDESVALTGCHRKHAVWLTGLCEEAAGSSATRGRPINFVSCRLGHGSIHPTLIYLEVVPDPTGSLASVP